MWSFRKCTTVSNVLEEAGGLNLVETWAHSAVDVGWSIYLCMYLSIYSFIHWTMRADSKFTACCSKDENACGKMSDLWKPRHKCQGLGRRLPISYPGAPPYQGRLGKKYIWPQRNGLFWKFSKYLTPNHKGFIVFTNVINFPKYLCWFYMWDLQTPFALT